MEKLSPIQKYIVGQMQRGKSLSSLYSTHNMFGEATHEFGGSLDSRSRSVSIPTIKAMLRKGLIVEASRHNVSDHLEHIEYALLK